MKPRQVTGHVQSHTGSSGKGEDKCHSLFNIVSAIPHCHNPERPKVNEAHSSSPEVCPSNTCSVKWSMNNIVKCLGNGSPGFSLRRLAVYLILLQALRPVGNDSVYHRVTWCSPHCFDHGSPFLSVTHLNTTHFCASGWWEIPSQ